MKFTVTQPFSHIISAEWRNISASLIKYHLENLTPGAKYNISLAGVTGGGEGPKARLTLNMLPEKPANGNRLIESALMYKLLCSFSSS